MTLIQFLIPQHLLSKLMFRFARIQTPWIKNTFTSWFVSTYKVDLKEAKLQDINEYKHFNDFFTRALKTDSRPISDSKVVPPVDGEVSQFGSIEESLIVQAKGKKFSVEALLANQSKKDLYTSFATIYLSPKDYHRIHMPLDGSLKSMKYIPGKLFSVNQNTVNNIDQVFARNERLICYFDTEFGEIALVMVGAIFVGSMETSWEGQITPPYNNSVKTFEYSSSQIKLCKVEELGRFNMGSTVILLLPHNAPSMNIEFNKTLKMGQSLT